MRKAYCLLMLLCACLAAAGQTGELPRSTPEAQGISTGLLNSFYRHLAAKPGVDVHHIMILRHDSVISEQHVAPYGADDMHNIFSASKTVTALAIGLAVDDGLLEVDDKVSKYLRDKMPATLSPGLDSLTIRDMLIMAAGRKVEVKLFEDEGTGDWLTAWFAGDFSNVGRQFAYDSMITHALAMIIRRVTGRTMLDYLRERIFTPLHITRADWEIGPDSVEIGGWGLRLQAESEAKLGLLLLHGGNWHGRQLVSRQWVHDMTQRIISTDLRNAPQLSAGQKFMRWMRGVWHTIRSWFTGYNIDDYFLGYGYHTKAVLYPRAEVFFAAGYGGQLIYVYPAADMVIVINGRAGNYGDELNTIYNYLIEPMLDARDLNEGPTALTIDLPRGQASSPVEQRLLGGRIDLEDNILGIKSIEVRRDGNDRIFTMTDKRGPLVARAACGRWKTATGDHRPVYGVECVWQLVGTGRPFTSAAAYAWTDERTLAMRLEWVDGGECRELEMAFDGDNVTVHAVDDNDPDWTCTINGKLH